eukprot:RCo020592
MYPDTVSPLAYQTVHALAVSANLFGTSYRTQPWAQSLCTLLLLSLGGSSLALLLLNQLPGVLVRPENLVPYLVVWFVTRNIIPGAFARLAKTPAFRMLLITLDSAHMAKVIIESGVERALAADHKTELGRFFVALLCGAMSGCAGGLVGQLIAVTEQEWHLQTPPMLKAKYPYKPLMAAACTVLYLTLREGPGFKPSWWTTARLATTAAYGAIEVMNYLSTTLAAANSAALGKPPGKPAAAKETEAKPEKPEDTSKVVKQETEKESSPRRRVSKKIE